MAVSTGGILGSTGVSGAGSGCDCTASTGDAAWRSANADRANTRTISTDGTFAPPETVAWRYEETGDIAVVDGTVYLRTGSGIHAIDAEDGSLVWKRTDLSADGTPWVADDTVYVGGKRLTALEASTGDVRWEVPFDGVESVSVQVVAFGSVYVIGDGRLYALDPSDGSIQWEFEPIYPDSEGEDGEYDFLQVIAANETLYVTLQGEPTNMIGELDPGGEMQWTFTDRDALYSAYALTATSDHLYILDMYYLSVFDLESKELETRFETEGDPFTLAVGDGTLVTTDRYTLYGGRSPESHEPTWETESDTGFGTPTIVDGTVVAARTSQDQEQGDQLVGFDLEDGSEQWQFTFDERLWGELQGFGAPVVVAGDTVYVTRDGELLALRTGTDGSDGSGEEPDEEDSDENGDDESSPDDGDGDEDGNGTNDTERTDENGGGSGDSDGSGNGTDADAGDGSDGTDGTNGSDGTDESDGDEGDSDDIPGFTTGAGAVGGLVSLEWLRRRTSGAERARNDERH